MKPSNAVVRYLSCCVECGVYWGGQPVRYQFLRDKPIPPVGSQSRELLPTHFSTLEVLEESIRTAVAQDLHMHLIQGNRRLHMPRTWEIGENDRFSGFVSKKAHDAASRHVPKKNQQYQCI